MPTSWADKCVAKSGYYDSIEQGRNVWEYHWNNFGQWLADHNFNLVFRLWRWIDEHFIAPIGVY